MPHLRRVRQDWWGIRWYGGSGRDGGMGVMRDGEGGSIMGMFCRGVGVEGASWPGVEDEGGMLENAPSPNGFCWNEIP